MRYQTFHLTVSTHKLGGRLSTHRTILKMQYRVHLECMGPSQKIISILKCQIHLAPQVENLKASFLTIVCLCCRQNTESLKWYGVPLLFWQDSQPSRISRGEEYLYRTQLVNHSGHQSPKEQMGQLYQELNSLERDVVAPGYGSFKVLGEVFCL